MPWGLMFSSFVVGTSVGVWLHWAFAERGPSTLPIMLRTLAAAVTLWMWYLLLRGTQVAVIGPGGRIFR